MTAPNQSEMFPDLPTVKMPKRVKSRWEELNELCDIVDEHGPIIPCADAARLLDLSRQRIHQLIDQGKLVPVMFGGRAWLAEKQLRAFIELKREPTGRGGKGSYVAAWEANPHFSPLVK